jgi:nucleotide-binding universal stress UspA family protein
MVYVDDVDSANACISLACDLADLFDAGLIGVSGSVPDIPIINPYTGGAMVAEIVTEEQRIAEEEVRRAEGRFRSVAGARRSQVAWRGAVEYPAELVAKHARAVDLIILGRDSLRPPPRHAADPGDVLMAAGRPVLVASPNSSQRHMLAHILVAWKDSRETRRAVTDSLPLLRKAEKVTVIGIAEEDDETSNRHSVDDVANFLHLHGVSASALAVSSDGRPAADLLLDYAKANGVGLIVLGGYGHARAREWIFGGVTRSLLRTSSICCLFSH